MKRDKIDIFKTFKRWIHRNGMDKITHTCQVAFLFHFTDLYVDAKRFVRDATGYHVGCRELTLTSDDSETARGNVSGCYGNTDCILGDLIKGNDESLVASL